METETHLCDLPVVQWVKNPPRNARDTGSYPALWKILHAMNQACVPQNPEPKKEVWESGYWGPAGRRLRAHATREVTATQKLP